MADQIHLSRAPIVEALIDFRVKPANGLTTETLMPLKDILKHSYPFLIEAKQFQTHVELKPIEGIQQQTTVAQTVGYRLESQDRKYVFQAQLGGFTLSRLAPYETWGNVFKEAQSLWKIYSTIAKPEAISRVAVRYINRLDFPLANLDFDEYLSVPPNIPKDLPQNFLEFLTRIVIRDQKSGASVIVIQALEPANLDLKSVSMLLDVDVFKEGPFEVDSDEYWQLILNFRALKNQAFFGSITNKTVERYL